MSISGNYSQILHLNSQLQTQSMNRDEASNACLEEMKQSNPVTILTQETPELLQTFADLKTKAFIIKNDGQFSTDLLKKISETTLYVLTISNPDFTQFIPVQNEPNILVPFSKEALPLNLNDYYLRTAPYPRSLQFKWIDIKDATTEAAKAYKEGNSLIGYQLEDRVRIVFDLSSEESEPLALDIPAQDEKNFRTQLAKILELEKIDTQISSDDTGTTEIMYFNLSHLKSQISGSGKTQRDRLHSINEEEEEEEEGLPELLQNYKLSENNSVFTSKNNSGSNSKTPGTPAKAQTPAKSQTPTKIE